MKTAGKLKTWETWPSMAAIPIIEKGDSEAQQDTAN